MDLRAGVSCGWCGCRLAVRPRAVGFLTQKPMTCLNVLSVACRRWSVARREGDARTKKPRLAACDTGKPTNAIAQSVAPRSGARRGRPWSRRQPGPFRFQHGRPGYTGGMNWTAHYLDRRLNRDVVTRSCATKEDALRLACDLMRRDCRVHFIMGPENQKVLAVEIIRW